MNANPRQQQVLHKGRKGRYHQRGFVLTIELILISTILIIGTFVGIAAIRDALIKSKVRDMDRSVLVSDADGQVLGEMVGLDEHEAPQLFYIDRTLPGDNHRALIGVRDDRFTSREPVYYTQRNCQGSPCMKTTSAETPDSEGVSRLDETGAVSYFHALQGFPNYAIGRSPDGVKGRLLRETTNSCPVESADGSRYMSQRVVRGEPCENYQMPVPAPDGDGAYCFGAEAVNCPAPACAALEISDPFGNVIARSCAVNPAAQPPTACAAGYDEAEVDLNDPGLNLSAGERDAMETALNTLGTLCCPAGTEAVQDSQFVQTILSTSGALPGGDAGRPIECKGGGTGAFILAEQVPDPDPGSGNTNTLDRFAAPFQVNLPAAGTTQADQWIYVPPDGEG